MKFWQSTALAALAVGIAAPAFAAGGTVSYVCQQGKQVDVSYQFNSRGKPVSARAPQRQQPQHDFRCAPL